MRPFLHNDRWAASLKEIPVKVVLSDDCGMIGLSDTP